MLRGKNDFGSGHTHRRGPVHRAPNGGPRLPVTEAIGSSPVIKAVLRGGRTCESVDSLLPLSDKGRQTSASGSDPNGFYLPAAVATTILKPQAILLRDVDSWHAGLLGRGWCSMSPTSQLRFHFPRPAW